MYNVFYSLPYQRLALESWFTNLDQTPLNRSQQLPAPYKRLIREFKQIATATSPTAVVDAVSWGEYVS